MEPNNFYRLRVLAGFIAFIFAFGWLFFANELTIWQHLYSFAIMSIFLIAAFLPIKVYGSRYRYLIASIYISGFIFSIPVFYDFLTSLHGIDYIGLVLMNIHLIVLIVFIKTALIKRNA
jgi:hypothetical protein